MGLRGAQQPSRPHERLRMLAARRAGSGHRRGCEGGGCGFLEAEGAQLGLQVGHAGGGGRLPGGRGRFDGNRRGPRALPGGLWGTSQEVEH
eukprot:11169718-Lingulodinium_polyedra.AAC.1